MSKIFGFFLSAAIIILCLMLNVYFYPNVVRQGIAKATDETTAAESTENLNDPRPLDEQKTQETPSAVPNDAKSGSATENTKDTEDKSDVNEGTKKEKSSINASIENNLLNVSVASNQKFSNSEKDEKSSDSVAVAPSNAEKPQGGKYVSIPSVEVDAFRSRFGSDSCRVIGVARASVDAE